MQQCDSPYVVKYYGSYFKNSDLWVNFYAAQMNSNIDKLFIQFLSVNRIQIIKNFRADGTAMIYNILPNLK